MVSQTDVHSANTSGGTAKRALVAHTAASAELASLQQWARPSQDDPGSRSTITASTERSVSASSTLTVPKTRPATSVKRATRHVKSKEEMEEQQRHPLFETKHQLLLNQLYSTSESARPLLRRSSRQTKTWATMMGPSLRTSPWA